MPPKDVHILIPTPVATRPQGKRDSADANKSRIFRRRTTLGGLVGLTPSQGSLGESHGEMGG